MSGIIYDIKRFAVHDGPGIRTTVFFKGCPLRCAWCHNPESIDPRPLVSDKKIIVDGCVMNETEETGRTWTTEEVMRVLEREAVFMEESGGGVTFSGGEPLQQTGFLEDLLIHSKKEGYHTVVDTSGQTAWSNFERILPMTDLFLFDLKHVDSAKHEAFTGIPNRLILKNLENLAANGKRIRIRVPVIPGFNYSAEEQEKIASHIKKFNGSVEQVDLLPFHAIAAHKYKRFGIGNRMEGIKSLYEEDLTDIVGIYTKAGILTTIGG
ncbi:glycyl-radical enzyme activating protein [Saccharicrinis sp. FJH54]|uniref:glycyl-radical enzyme activating protein n=1 Tax=Saccharicrinis sp. FJH54 TaxID=3344665 RepID=UPI0035D3E605